MHTDITLAELNMAIRKLKKRHSPGPDKIKNEMLQHLGNIAPRYRQPQLEAGPGTTVLERSHYDSHPQTWQK